MVWQAAAAQAVVSVVAAKKAYDAKKQAGYDAQAELEAYREAISKIPLPDLKKIALEEPAFMGEMAPHIERVKFEQLDLPEEITTDPRFSQAQMSALESMGEISREGMTTTDQLNLEKIRQRADRDASSSQQATMQRMAERGMGGSGAELAQNLLMQQSRAQRGGMEGLELAAQKRQAAMNAIAQKGAMAGDMRTQEFGESESNRKARMIREDFNAKMGMDADRSNQQYYNAALQRDKDTEQTIENMRAGNRNTEQSMENQRRQQLYNNELAKEQAKGGVTGDIAGAKTAKGQLEANSWGAVSDVVKGGTEAYAQSQDAGAQKLKDDREFEYQREKDDKDRAAKYGDIY